MDQIGEKLDGINKTLKEQNEIIKDLLISINKPGNLIIKIVQIAAACATIFGVFQAIDIIIKWATGG